MSSAKASHTAGRLVSEPSEPGRRSPVDAEPDSRIMTTEHGALVGSIYNDRGDGAEMAARLTACWNALVGVADPEGAVRGLRELSAWATEVMKWHGDDIAPDLLKQGCRIEERLQRSGGSHGE